LTFFCFLIILPISISARRLWEPEDAMPIFSTADVIGLEFSENFFYIAVSKGIIRFPRLANSIDIGGWECFAIAGELHSMYLRNDSVYIWTDLGGLARTEMDFFDIPFKSVDEFPRFPPNIGGCVQSGERYMMPPGFIWGSGDTIYDYHLNSYHITDCAEDGHGTMFLATNGAGIFSVEHRIGIAEPFCFGPCCNDIHSIIAIGDTLIFGGCGDIVHCALSIYDRLFDDFEWFGGEYSAMLPSSGPVKDLEFHDNLILGTTPNGLILFDIIDKTYLRPYGIGSQLINTPRASAIFNDSIYIAADNGIYTADIQSRAFKKISAPELTRFTDIDTANGRLYAIGDRGVWIVHDSTLERFYTPDGYLTNFVSCVTAGPNGETVFGSRAGILIITQNGNRTTLPSSIWLDGYTPNDIIAMKNILWIATNKGLFLYNRKINKSTLIGNDYYLPELNIYRMLLDQDYIWLITSRGLYRFFWNEPDRIEY